MIGGQRKGAAQQGLGLFRCIRVQGKLAPFGHSVTAKTKALIAAKQKSIENHTFNEFCGPVYNQAGKVQIPKGTCLDPKTKSGINALYSMQWLVKGVVGSVSHVQPSG